MARGRKKAEGTGELTLESAVKPYRHKGAKRKNNPPAKIAAEGSVPLLPKTPDHCNPHRPPSLRFDPTGGPDAEGLYTVEMKGFDIYKPVENTMTPTRAEKVAAWFLDSDYDGWASCITQAFFPDKGAWDKLARSLKGVFDEDAFEAFSGTESLPFRAGQHKCVAVKVIDPSGNEVMRVMKL